ncbi:hypothetical protein [Nocardia flavorosea]|uniref:Uncharacterized protein n=1 Tax=Nocardia flavorosea TaxID=53429 RepID=A0A846YN00_9NOCA|nr:hypothetical protein [Nocardia flavorosea]NKY60425.1 hypothetical protein [Nocardia flavorosea]
MSATPAWATVGARVQRTHAIGFSRSSWDTTIERITPTGQVVTSDGERFTPQSLFNGRDGNRWYRKYDAKRKATVTLRPLPYPDKD